MEKKDGVPDYKVEFSPEKTNTERKLSEPRVNAKLREAEYFLKKLRELLLEEPRITEFSYNLSAFITAWRSVFDVLLYDYAERYFNIDRDDKIQFLSRDFKVSAQAIKDIKPEPLKFINWYNKKEGILSEQHIWFVRKIFVHKGLPKTKKYVVDSSVCMHACNQRAF